MFNGLVTIRARRGGGPDFWGPREADYMHALFDVPVHLVSFVAGFECVLLCNL